MKHLLVAGLWCLSFLSSAQTPIQATVSGNIFNTVGDSVYISQFYGTHYVNFIGGKLDKKGNFKLTGKLPAKDYYVLRISKNQHINIILKDKSNIQIYGDGKNITAFHNIVGSDESSALNDFIVRLQLYNQKKDSATAYLQQFPDQQEAVNRSFTPVYQDFNNYKQRFIAENNNSPALLPVISTIDANAEFPAYESIVNQLVAGFDGSPAINQLKANCQQMKEQQNAMNFLAPGKEAPDFSQAKADGSQLKLSDLRGKVVLIDFWASWCGPCRRENPNVVKLYEQYGKDGFTVLSVSLDKDKAAWLAAIEKDQLSWPNHVSDLKFWQNEAAKTYKVTGIPFTVLVDREGKIINTKLRGPELEQALQQIFGH
jgi:thiol-disulfide isomerase/thioredoxin